MAHRSSTRPVLGIGLALLLALGALLVPAPPVGAFTQGIAGTLTAAGVPVQDGEIAAFDVSAPSRYPVATAYAQFGNDYHLELAPGQYWVRFTGYDDLDFAPEWWGNSPTRQGSTMVTVTAGTVSPLNVDVEKGGTISGFIAQAMSATGSQDALVSACLIDTSFPDGCDRVGYSTVDDADNRYYTIRGLPSGTYKVYFRLRRSAHEGWWENATSQDTATPVAVTAPSDTGGISPVNLPSLGVVSGKVTDAATGAGLDQVDITLYSQDESGAWNGVYGEYTVTASDGTYSLPAPAGTYRIEFHPPGPTGLRTEYWNDAPTVEGGQDVAVTPGTAFSGRNAALESLSPITNTSLPQVTQTPRVGSLIGSTNGSWAPELPYGEITFTRQWLRNGVPIPNAIYVYYLLTPADAGQRISVRVTASRTGIPSATATSLPVTVPLQSLRLLSSASISGILRVGRTLRAVAPRTSPTASVRYQWLRSGKAIRGARAARYTLVRADRGRRIAVRITLTRTGYATVIRTARRSALVK